LLDKETLEESLQIKFDRKSLLITFHPATLEYSSAELQMQELLDVLSELRNTTLLFTMTNADTGGRILIKMVDDFVKQHSNARAFNSLGQLRYLSCVAQVDGVVGNSSSGLAEVPSFKKGTINIGDRQMGRLHATSVINSSPNRESIRLAIERLYSDEFQALLPYTLNPYGVGGASARIVEIIRDIPLEGMIKKTFHDL